MTDSVSDSGAAVLDPPKTKTKDAPRGDTPAPVQYLFIYGYIDRDALNEAGAEYRFAAPTQWFKRARRDTLIGHPPTNCMVVKSGAEWPCNSKPRDIVPLVDSTPEKVLAARSSTFVKFSDPENPKSEHELVLERVSS